MSEAESRQLTLVNQVEDARLLRQTMETLTPRFPPPSGSAFTPGSWAQLEADGVSRALKSHYDEAIALFLKSESLSPGNYSVAANLGTTYELAGQNQNALRWITEALRRNPDSHRQTEWIHLLILQEKVRRDQFPDAPFAPLIPLPAEFTADTLISASGTTRPAQEVKRSIHYQLRERMKFVKPQDIYVADLLFTLSQIDGRLHGPESAYEYVKLAEAYGYSDHARLQSANAPTSNPSSAAGSLARFRGRSKPSLSWFWFSCPCAGPAHGSCALACSAHDTAERRLP